MEKNNANTLVKITVDTLANTLRTSKRARPTPPPPPTTSLSANVWSYMCIYIYIYAICIHFLFRSECSSVVCCSVILKMLTPGGQKRVLPEVSDDTDDVSCLMGIFLRNIIVIIIKYSRSWFRVGLLFKSCCLVWHPTLFSSRVSVLS
jgi:hypothetical protein